MITIGDKASDFALQGYVGDEIKTFKLQNYKNKWVVLFFYPTDFSDLCSTEIAALTDAREEIKKTGAELFAISVDSIHSHRAWAKELGDLYFPLLSDFHKRTAHQYGVLNEEAGNANRATFVVDPEGTIRWINISSSGTGRSIMELLRSLSALQTNRSCPANWRPGEATL
ncbi:hypothetical protein A3K24_00445 [candidate division Kazan bacterium RIFCSPHIGHO2_01_FULL_44_14]|uniref:Thioredoxin domain-containing protein n=1 Tax=candidate division Kazan bacterium RIFCSPLOWO2_01_FULL_45_19 TaxID=1798538 RepID=A0A1F4NPP3_UNCK3|nr:MAG: hypothetical protein A3K51_00445 [candidate division Kazan bacterium RIFCSPLOWO2_01_FULL_45_19]OGB77581.1 MAG: hypothetical protein A3K24_00445 [candidate division Kazan bacterium RIFCSPHIGHO2_01_FULL_44_14]